MRFPSFLQTGLGLILLCGLSSTARSETRYPVVAKVQFIFSLVSHYSHITDRVNFYNNSGSPQGNSNYAVPHLVYDPVITLYNPYNTTLTVTRSRVKIWDPPVGFSFKKNDAYLRDDFAAGTFLGLARFQLQNESNPDARKTFTLSLTGLRTNQLPGNSFTLLPGQIKTFSAWVENSWTWGKETAGGFVPIQFFDWNRENDFTNKDARTGSLMGAETVPSLFPYLGDPRAGFQTDGLSVQFGRPEATRYSFETSSNWTDNWVAIKLADTISVQAKAMRTNPVSGGPDYQVDLFKGIAVDPTIDLVKSFPMDLAGIIQNDEQPVITRTFRVGDLLQRPTDLTLGGKTPFASFTMIAKASALRSNRFLTEPAVPTSELYESHFSEMSDFSMQSLISPSDAPTGAPEVQGVSRIGNTLYIDFSGHADVYGTKKWKIRGTSSLEAGFTDDLGSLAGINNSMSASGIYKAIIDVSGLGDRYFVRIEE